MAQSFATPSGVLKIPGAFPDINVVSQNTGLSVTGVLFLVGESNSGPDFTQEADLAANIFGPSQIGDVRAKYGSGPLVDAFNGAAVPANDSAIPGAFQAAILVKTNPSTKATAGLVHWNSSAYATLEDRNWGKTGNLISYQVTAKTSEVKPTTGAFAFMLPIASTNIDVRVNGGAASAITIAALETPTTFAAALDAVPGVDVSGGASNPPLTGTTGTLALTVLTGNKVQIDRSVAFDALPTIGDTLFVPDASVLASVHANNAGSYIVTGASASQILATKLLDTSGTPAQLTPPTSQTALAIVSASNDLKSYTAITAHLVTATDPIDGYGKNLQINELTSGTGVFSTLAYVLGTSGAVKVGWVSKSGAPTLIVSGTEYSAAMNEARQLDNITNDVVAGGAIALKLGYVGTTASAVVDATNITITTVGGSSPGTLVASLTDFVSIADLAAYIDSFAGFTCEPGTAVLGSQPSTTLDRGTFGICSTWGDTPGRIKQDAYKFFTTLRDNGLLTQLDKQATAGLPAPTASVAFLTGGAKGATTDAIIQAALDALKMVRGNFLVPLFSRDAVDDIADNKTDPSSTYTIAAVHAASRSHVLQMSTLKKRRHRQAFLSQRSTFETVKTTSANLASSRCSLSFQDVRDLGTNGSVTQFQPWMNAVKAAAMQAAGFYKAIFNKGINISGALQAAGDFNDQDDDKVEQGLDAGLLIIQRPMSGGFKYVSDQTTYGKDNNFVFNSIQAMYVSDTIALTTAQLMEQAFVGQSLADISASLALGTLEGIMENLKRLKLIAFSDDAPKGFKNVVIKITGPAMVVSLEVKAATALYFIPITFQISQVTQSASG